MKKFFGISILVILIGMLFVAVAPVLADDGDNMDKAAQAALKIRENVLIDKKAAIETMVPQVVSDGTVTTDEMVAFKKAIDEINTTKQTFDEELKVYGIATSTALEKEYQGARDVYFKRGLNVRDDDGGTVRKFFASETGQDVVVKDNWGFAGDKSVGFLIATILCLIVAGLCWWAGDACEDGFYLIAFFFTLFFVVLAFLLFLM